MKKPIGMRLDPRIIEMLEVLATKHNRSNANMIETLIEAEYNKIIKENETMKLALIDYNRGQMPSSVKEGLKLCTIYNKKDIIEYLSNNCKGIHKVNTNGYVFGFCEEEYQQELQDTINARG